MELLSGVWKSMLVIKECYRNKYSLVELLRVANSRESTQKWYRLEKVCGTLFWQRRSVGDLDVTIDINQRRVTTPNSCIRLGESTSSLILRDTGRFQGRQACERSSLVVFVDVRHHRKNPSTQRVDFFKQSIACWQWRNCLLACLLKETIIAIHCTVWVKKIPPPLRFSDIFSQTVGNFWSKFYMPIIRSHLR